MQKKRSGSKQNRHQLDTNDNVQWHQKKSYEKKSKRKKNTSNIWLYGKHSVMSALANPERVCLRLLTSKESEKETNEIAKLIENRSSLYVETLSRIEIESFLPDGAVHQGFALNVAPLQNVHIEDICQNAEEKSVVVVLDQVTDPHNVGAILRSAVAFNALAVIVADRHAPEESGVIAKSASGAMEKIPLIRVANLARTLKKLKDSGFWCTGLDSNGKENISKAELPDKIALIFGSEGKGLRRLTLESCDFLVRLPISDKVESLNVSNAVAITLYETTKWGE